MTRPDCYFAHAFLSRFVQYSGSVHMQAALRILAYVRGTIDQCVVSLTLALHHVITIACGGGLTRTMQDAKTRADLTH